jgi:hypothetical protein
MLFNARNLWLLLLPLTAIASWLIPAKPVAVEVEVEVTNTRYPNLVMSNNDNNFYQLEQLLSEVYVTDGNKLIINAQTEKYLSQAVNRFGLKYDQILFAKTFPSAPGNQLGRLLHCYAEYTKVEQQISKAYLSMQTGEQLLDYRVLQSIFFGELAKNLFANHHQFYENIAAAGVSLLSPSLIGITAAPVCADFRGQANE